MHVYGSLITNSQYWILHLHGWMCGGLALKCGSYPPTSARVPSVIQARIQVGWVEPLGTRELVGHRAGLEIDLTWIQPNGSAGWVSTMKPIQSDTVWALHKMSARTCQSDKSLDRAVQAVLGHGCPKRGWTCLSKQIFPPVNSSDKPVWQLVGRLCPRTSPTGRSNDLLDRHVQVVSWGSGANILDQINFLIPGIEKWGIGLP
jgi:hypothetical protein